MQACPSHACALPEANLLSGHAHVRNSLVAFGNLKA